MSDEQFITGEIRNLKNDVNSVMLFAEGMAAKLRKNSHKAHWSKASIGYLQSRLSDENIELEQAIAHDTDEAIISECYDVANFAMMIADNIRNGIR